MPGPYPAVDKLCGTFKKTDWCGTPNGYLFGCRQDSCRDARNAYRREHDARKGTYVDATEARNHINFLISRGALKIRIAQCAGVSRGMIYDILRNPNGRVCLPNEEKILAINLLSPIFKDARGSGNQTRTNHKNQKRDEKGWWIKGE